MHKVSYERSTKTVILSHVIDPFSLLYLMRLQYFCVFVRHALKMFWWRLERSILQLTEKLGVILKFNGMWIAVIEVEPACKASFVHSCIQTRLMRQCNGIWSTSLKWIHLQKGCKINCNFSWTQMYSALRSMCLLQTYSTICNSKLVVYVQSKFRNVYQKRAVILSHVELKESWFYFLPDVTSIFVFKFQKIVPLFVCWRVRDLSRLILNTRLKGNFRRERCHSCFSSSITREKYALIK